MSRELSSSSSAPINKEAEAIVTAELGRGAGGRHTGGGTALDDAFAVRRNAQTSSEYTSARIG